MKFITFKGFTKMLLICKGHWGSRHLLDISHNWCKMWCNCSSPDCESMLVYDCRRENEYGGWKWSNICQHLYGFFKEWKTTHIEPIIDDRKETFLKSWKGVLCVHFRVCVSVCRQATEQTFWHRSLIFGLNDPLDMRRKQIFLFSEIWF